MHSYLTCPESRAPCPGEAMNHWTQLELPTLKAIVKTLKNDPDVWAKANPPPIILATILAINWQMKKELKILLYLITEFSLTGWYYFYLKQFTGKTAISLMFLLSPIHIFSPYSLWNIYSIWHGQARRCSSFHCRSTALSSSAIWTRWVESLLVKEVNLTSRNF